MQHLRGLVAGRERALKDDGHAGCLQGGSLKNKGRDAGVGQGGIEQPQGKTLRGKEAFCFQSTGWQTSHQGAHGQSLAQPVTVSSCQRAGPE